MTKKRNPTAESLIEVIPDLIFLLDSQGTFLYYRANIEDDLYIPPEIFVGKNVSEVMPPLLSQKIKDSITRTLDTKEMQILEYELPIKVKDNSSFFEARFVVSGENEVLTIVRNITTRKQMENELRIREELHRGVVENIGIGISIINKNNEILSLNQQMKQWFPNVDASQKPICHQSYNNPPRSTHCDNCPTIQTLDDGSRHESIVEKPFNGTTRHYKIVSTPLKDIHGKIYAAVELVEDITQTILLNKQLVTKAEELEKSNQELKETTLQLVHTEKLSALGELTAGIAHELSQPLNGMKIICQSLIRDMQRSTVEPSYIINEVAEAVSQVDHMANIIDHMRLFTRFSDDSLMTPSDLNDIVRAPFKLIGQQIKVSDIKLNLALEKELPFVLGNPLRLEQVFMNLYINAKKSLDECTRENKQISISTYRTTDPKLMENSLEQEMVVAEIEDNGLGIPKPILKKIFQPFFTTRGPGQGTGLGLSISHKIIEDHRGKILVESQENIGTTFKVVLPISH